MAQKLMAANAEIGGGHDQLLAWVCFQQPPVSRFAQQGQAIHHSQSTIHN